MIPTDMSIDRRKSSCEDVLDHDRTLDELFQTYVKPFVHGFVTGFNTCLFLMGEQSAGQNILLNGHALEMQGIVGHLILSIFQQLNHGDSVPQNSQRNSSDLSVMVYLVRAENIEDLLTGTTYRKGKLQLCDTIEDGHIVKELTNKSVHTAQEANEIMRLIFPRYFGLAYGTNQMPTTEPLGLFLRFHLSSTHLSDMDNLTRSTLTVFALTGVESLAVVLKQPQSADLRTHGIVSLYELINQLASGPPGQREFPNYGISMLTRLLSNELGGNCFTRVLLSLSSKPDSEVHAILVHMASRMTRIVNCPIVNDQAALLWAARSRELCRQVAKAAAATGSNTINGTQADQFERSTVHAIAYTNSRNLRQNVEELTKQLEQVSRECAHNTDERIRLSKLWMMGEEQNIRLNEQLVTAQTDLDELLLKNKEMESISSKALEASKRAVELKRANDLLNGYCTDLHKKLDELQLQLNSSAETNEELSRELLHQLRKQKDYLGQLTTNSDSKAWRLDAIDELKRLESMLQIQVSSTEHKISNAMVSDLRIHEGQRGQLKRNSTKQNGLTWHRPDASKRNQLKRSDQEAQLIIVAAERDQMKREIDKMEKNVVRFLDHFRTRLVYHIHGITFLMCRNVGSYGSSHLIKESKSADKLIARHATLGLGRYLRHLLADMNAAHKARESQLVNTVRRAQQRTQVAEDSVKQIMVAYVRLRNRMMESGIQENELGPPPLELLDLVTRTTDPPGFQLHLTSKVLPEITQPIRQNSKANRSEP